jgi:hypothetical protein
MSKSCRIALVVLASVGGIIATVRQTHAQILWPETQANCAKQLMGENNGLYYYATVTCPDQDPFGFGYTTQACSTTGCNGDECHCEVTTVGKTPLVPTPDPGLTSVTPSPATTPPGNCDLAVATARVVAAARRLIDIRTNPASTPFKRRTARRLWRPVVQTLTILLDEERSSNAKCQVYQLFETKWTNLHARQLRQLEIPVGLENNGEAGQWATGPQTKTQEDYPAAGDIPGNEGNYSASDAGIARVTYELLGTPYVAYFQLFKFTRTGDTGTVNFGQQLDPDADASTYTGVVEATFAASATFSHVVEVTSTNEKFLVTSAEPIVVPQP